MSHRHSLLGLPCEIRQLIYREYFALPGGYILSPNLRQLTASNGEPIDLNLIYTCSLIARETKGLAFSLNTLTVSTVHSEYLNLAARRFRTFLREIYDEQRTQLKRFFFLVDEDMHTQVVNKFPSFKDNMDHLLLVAQHRRPTYLDMANRPLNFRIRLLEEHQHHQAIRYLLRLITSLYDKNVMDPIRGEPISMYNEAPRYVNLPYETVCKLIHLCDDPWDIPTRSQLNDMTDVFARLEEEVRELLTNGELDTKYRFSAAAATISFLRSIPSATRHQIRNITINEDHDSVAYTQCHVEGLIPFFKENLHLRVERRINLWRTIFQGVIEYDSSCGLSSDLTLWFASIFSLGPAGVPSNSMVTFFDGNPAPEACSQVFQSVIQRDVALTRTAAALFTESIFDQDLDFHVFYWGKFGDLLLGLEHLANGSPILRCNFDPGEMWDIQSRCDQWSADKFYGEWISDEWVEREDPPQVVNHPLIVDYAADENTYTGEEYDKLVEYARQNGFA